MSSEKNKFEQMMMEYRQGNADESWRQEEARRRAKENLDEIYINKTIEMAMEMAKAKIYWWDGGVDKEQYDMYAKQIDEKLNMKEEVKKVFIRTTYKAEAKLDIEADSMAEAVGLLTRYWGVWEIDINRTADMLVNEPFYFVIGKKDKKLRKIDKFEFKKHLEMAMEIPVSFSSYNERLNDHIDISEELNEKFNEIDNNLKIEKGKKIFSFMGQMKDYSEISVEANTILEAVETAFREDESGDIVSLDIYINGDDLEYIGTGKNQPTLNYKEGSNYEAKDLPF